MAAREVNTGQERGRGTEAKTHVLTIQHQVRLDG